MISKSSRSLNLLIESTDFFFIDGESNSAGVEFEAEAVEVALELTFFG